MASEYVDIKRNKVLLPKADMWRSGVDKFQTCKNVSRCQGDMLCVAYCALYSDGRIPRPRGECQRMAGSKSGTELRRSLSANAKISGHCGLLWRFPNMSWNRTRALNAVARFRASHTLSFLRVWLRNLDLNVVSSNACKCKHSKLSLF